MATEFRLKLGLTKRFFGRRPQIATRPVWLKAFSFVGQARFRRRSTHVPNLIDELSPAKERRLNQFGTAVLIRCGNVVKFDKVCRIIRHWSGN